MSPGIVGNSKGLNEFYGRNEDTVQMAEPQESKEKLHVGRIQGKDEMVWANYTENNRNLGQSDTTGRMFCLDYGSEYI